MSSPFKDIVDLFKEIPPQIFSFLLWPLGVITLIFSGVYFYNRSKIQKIVQVLGGRISLSNKGYGVWEGLPYEIAYKPGGRHESAHLELWIPHDFPGEFGLSRETKIDQFFQKLRFSQELKTGDEVFDGNFYIETNTEEPVRQLFLQETKRRATEALFAAGIIKIEHTGKCLMLDKYPFPKESREVIEILKKTKDLLEGGAYVGTSGQQSFGTSRNLKGWVGGFGALLLITGFISFLVSAAYHAFDGGGLFLFSLRYSIPPLLCFWAALVFFFRGKSFFHRLLFPVLVSSLAGALLLGFSWTKILNVRKDTARPQYRQVLVLDRRKEGKHSDIPYLYVEGWKPGRVTEKFQVSGKFFAQAIPQKTVVILETKPGHFGFEWLVRVQIMSPEVLVAEMSKAKNKTGSNPAYSL